MLIKNVRLLAELTDGKTSESGAVRVEQGKITAVYTTDTPADEGAVDGRGMTLLPGLIDAHTHIACLRGYDSSQLKNPMHFFTRTALDTQRYLQYGFTTIRDCGVPLRVNTAVRDAIEQGLFDGPRILSCGLILSPTEVPEDDGITDMYAFCDSPAEDVRAVRKELAEQADFIKVMASGSALHKNGIPVQPIVTETEMEAIVESAKLKGSYVAAHAHGDGAIRLCVDTGVRTIEHASYISKETIRAMSFRDDACWLIPTVSAMYQNPETTSEAYQYLVKKLQKMLEMSAVCLKEAYENGVPMGFGTDSGPGMDQYEEGIEFTFRKSYCGMKEIDILKQATVNNARALGIDHLTGQIKEGLSADLILVDGKPEQDITVMCKRPQLVWKAGKLVAGAAVSCEHEKQE